MHFEPFQPLPLRQRGELRVFCDEVLHRLGVGLRVLPERPPGRFVDEKFIAVCQVQDVTEQQAGIGFFPVAQLENEAEAL